MDSHVTQSAFYNFLGWAEVNKKRLLTFFIAIAVVSAIVAFFIWHSNQREIEASEALSTLRAPQSAPNTPGNIPSEDYLRFASEHPKTSAALRASLLAGGALFTENKYSEALAQFEKVVRENPESPIRSEAMLGVASCLDAQGKVAEATLRYKEVIDRFAGTPAATQAKFALARLYEVQNKPDLALKLYEELARDELLGSISLRSQVRVAELGQRSLGPRPSGVSAPKLLPK